MAGTYQATKGGEFAPLIGLRDVDMDIGRIIAIPTKECSVLGRDIAGKALDLRCSRPM